MRQVAFAQKFSELVLAETYLSTECGHLWKQLLNWNKVLPEKKTLKRNQKTGWLPVYAGLSYRMMSRMSFRSKYHTIEYIYQSIRVWSIEFTFRLKKAKCKNTKRSEGFKDLKVCSRKDIIGKYDEDTVPRKKQNSLVTITKYI